MNLEPSMSIQRNPSIDRTRSRIFFVLVQYASSPSISPHWVGLIERHASSFLARIASSSSRYSSTAASTAACSALCSPRRFRIAPSPRRFASSARARHAAIVSPATHCEAKRKRSPTAPAISRYHSNRFRIDASARFRCAKARRSPEARTREDGFHEEDSLQGPQPVRQFSDPGRVPLDD